MIDAYHRYIACLNERDLGQLKEFVDAAVEYNGEPVGLDRYRQMLEWNFRDIPDLRFTVALVIADGDTIAARLTFDCRPSGRFLGLDIGGRRVSFCENVFYAYEGGKIRRVWSVLDKTAIEAQLP